MRKRDDARGIRISEVNIRADALTDTCELYVMALPAEDMEPPREGEDPRSTKEEEKE